LYGQAGITDVRKKDLKDAEGRKERHDELTERLREYAGILEEQLELFEKELEGVEEKTRKHELAPYVLSIPGIGIAGVILAYIGDGSRFSTAGQAANYAGPAPRVDCSGETS
jgi:transposase